jgi:hypothetical protein
VRLAPLYDVNSVLPYLAAERRGVSPGQVSMHTARLAMSIGGRALLNDLDADAWTGLSSAIRLPPAMVLDRVASLVERTPAAVNGVVEAATATAALTTAQRAFVEGLRDAIVERAGLCRAALKGRGPATRHRAAGGTVANVGDTAGR